MRGVHLWRLPARASSRISVPATECALRDLHVGFTANSETVAERSAALPWRSDLGGSIAPSVRMNLVGNTHSAVAPVAPAYRGAFGLVERSRGSGALNDFKGMNYELSAARKAGITQTISRSFASEAPEDPGKQRSVATGFTAS